MRIGGELLVDQPREIGALPARSATSSVCARASARDAAFDRRDVGFDGVGAGQPDDRLHHGQRVLAR